MHPTYLEQNITKIIALNLQKIKEGAIIFLMKEWN